MKLYNYCMDCGRAGDLKATFAAEPEEIAAIIGRDIDFGEAFGKHSEVVGTMEASEFTEVDASPAFIEEFARLFPHGLGHNPLSYVEL